MNTTFRLAPWADVLYAMDRAWWAAHIAEVRRTFTGKLVTPQGNCFGATQVRFNHSRNSGAGAIALAAHWGVRRVVMLGYDCQKTDGKAHWHGDHPKGLGNAGSVSKWPAMFRDLAARLRGVEVVNASRQTALNVFPCVPLEEALCAS